MNGNDKVETRGVKEGTKRGKYDIKPNINRVVKTQVPWIGRYKGEDLEVVKEVIQLYSEKAGGKTEGLLLACKVLKELEEK